MKVLKTTGIVLLGIIAVWLIAAAVLPKHFEYERSTDINASKSAVYNVINDVRSWEKWGPWQEADTTMKISYGDKTEGLGASYSWTSKNSGNGTMTITEATEPTLQKARLEFEGQGGGDSWFKLEDGIDGATKTSWGFAFEVSWPFNIFPALSGEGEMNKMFDKGLSNLKTLVEEKAAEEPAAGKFNVQTVDFSGKTYLGIREKTTIEASMAEEFFGERFGKILELVNKSNIEMNGSPSGLYFSWDETAGTTEMAVALPIKKGAAVSGGNIKMLEVPASKALLIDYQGSYEGLADAHYAMDDYLKANNLTVKMPVIEEYFTDPATEPDQSKWLTKIYYLIESPMAAEQ